MVLKTKQDLKETIRQNADLKKAESGGFGRRRGPIEVKKVSNLKGTILRILSYLKKDVWIIGVIIVTIVFATLLNTYIPTLFSEAIDDYIIPFEFDGLYQVAIIIITFAAINSVVRFLARFLMIRISQKAIKQIRTDAFDKLMKLPVSYFDQKGAGDINSRISSDVELINNSLAQTLVQFINTTFILLGVSVLMFRLNWALSLIVVLFMPLLFLVVIFISKKTRKYFKAQQVHLASINGIVEENVSGLEVVKLYNQEQAASEEFHEENEKLKKAAFTAQFFSGLLWPFIHFFNNFIYLMVILAGGFMYVTFGVTFISIGDISGVAQYARQFVQPISQIGELFNALMQGIAGAERIFELMDEASEYDASETNELNKLDGEITFKNVGFSYVPDKPILKDVSFNAKKGSILAIVGPTGGGKTTLIKLINHFYDLNEGTIYLDDLDIKTIHKDALRKRIGIVLQDTHLFKGSIFENIQYGDLNATSEQVIEAAKKAGAHDFITKLPDRYDTVVLEGGNNFSQGERQLISIARTLLNDPDLLILDEATSSIDTRTEAKIQASLKTLMKNRTSIVIAHRLQTIENADKIIVINEGMLIEEGTHETLLSQKGFYHDLYHSQFAS